MRREHEYVARGELAKTIREEVKRKPTKAEIEVLKKALKDRVPRRRDSRIE